jgi:hypothetical protein
MVGIPTVASSYACFRDCSALYTRKYLHVMMLWYVYVALQSAPLIQRFNVYLTLYVLLIPLIMLDAACVNLMNSLAAITGEGVFNFGEVVATAAVKALANTPNAWLGQLLEAFNKGDIDAFNTITADNKVCVTCIVTCAPFALLTVHSNPVVYCEVSIECCCVYRVWCNFACTVQCWRLRVVLR